MTAAPTHRADVALYNHDRHTYPHTLSYQGTVDCCVWRSETIWCGTGGIHPFTMPIINYPSKMATTHNHRSLPLQRTRPREKERGR